jgi:hypothetical protein
MSPWVLSPAAVSSNACRAYVCCETKQIGARRRDAILINAGADPSHDGNALSAYSPPQNHRCMGRFVRRFLFSAAGCSRDGHRSQNIAPCRAFDGAGSDRPS